MPRPRKQRRLRFRANVHYFKPRGIPLRELGEVTLLADEVEALKLHDLDNLSHIDAAREMNVSQPTFSRILNRAYSKLSQAVVLGKAIKIEKNKAIPS